MGINNYNPFSLEGKTILITGASSGIGRSTAVECSKMGAKVILTARNEERLKETLAQLEGEGHSYILADMASTDELDRLVEQLPMVNGVVNNAGYSIMQLVNFIKSSDLEQVIKVDMQAPIYLTSRLVKKKKLGRQASVVFTSSIAGKGVCSPGNSLYSAAKGGMNAFMKNAALELGGKGIRCNAVLPGMVETPLKEGRSTITEEQWELNRQLYPLKRFGQPEDVAFAIVYLLSDASVWMTGAELVIDGGRSLK